MRSTGKQDLVNIYAQSITMDGSGCVLYDVNLDGSVDVLDIVVTIGIILNTVDSNPDQQCAADVNEDSAIDVLDIVTIISLSLIHI